MLRLLDPTGGTIRFDGRDITRLSQRGLRPLRREMQMIFQDPYASLNPRKTVEQIVAPAVRDPRWPSRREAKLRVRELLGSSGSAPSTPAATRTSSRAASDSGSASRARSRCNPKLIVCDEPVSALDVSVQAQILNLLRALQVEFDLTYVFISHDLSVMRQICTRIAVMYLGRVVELADSEQIFEHPRHPYTAALISAVPRVSVNGDAARARSSSAATSPRRSTRRAAACSTLGAHASTRATATSSSPARADARRHGAMSQRATTRSSTRRSPDAAAPPRSGQTAP